MIHGIESLTEGEVRDIPRGHRVDRDSPADLDLGEDASEAVAGDLSDRVVERRVPKTPPEPPPPFSPPHPTSPPPWGGGRPRPKGQAPLAPPADTPPHALARAPRDQGDAALQRPGHTAGTAFSQ